MNVFNYQLCNVNQKANEEHQGQFDVNNLCQLEHFIYASWRINGL